MNLEVGTKAAQFLFGEYINRISLAVLHQVPIYLKNLVGVGGGGGSGFAVEIRTKTFSL
jgi:hypothetical protein